MNAKPNSKRIIKKRRTLVTDPTLCRGNIVHIHGFFLLVSIDEYFVTVTKSSIHILRVLSFWNNFKIKRKSHHHISLHLLKYDRIPAFFPVRMTRFWKTKPRLSNTVDDSINTSQHHWIITTDNNRGQGSKLKKQIRSSHQLYLEKNRQRIGVPSDEEKSHWTAPDDRQRLGCHGNVECRLTGVVK